MKRTQRPKQKKPTPHDAYFKATFGRPTAAAEFLRHYLPPEIVRLLDLTRLELEKDTFVDAQLRRHFSDLLYRVGLLAGGEAFIYFLLEHKSAPDEWTMLQLLRYVAQAWEQMRQRGAKKLPVIIPVIFYHGAEAWSVATRLSELIEWPAGSEALRHYAPEAGALLCDLSQYRDEELVGGDALPADLRLMKYVFRDELTTQLPGIFRAVIEQADEAEALERLETMVHYLTEAERVSQPEVGAALERAQRGDKPMETIIDKWRKEARREGRKEGKQEGKQEGTAELTLFLLRQRVGELDRATQAQVRALPVAQLQRLSVALSDFSAREDLTAWLQRHASATRKAPRTAASRKKK
jgi:predicted transposase YdaD